jgi:CRISPR-associated protein Csx10
MKQIQLTIQAQAPLAIGTKKPGSVSEAADYIPGSVIRGAIAGQLLRLSQRQPQTNDDFSKIFVEDGAAIFSNAYPSQQGYPVSVLPSTAVSAKLKSGFKPKGEGVFDTLIDRYCAEQWQQQYTPKTPTGDRVEPFSGFYTCDFKTKKYQKESVSKRLLTRVGINRRRNASEEQILYSLEVINETYLDKDINSKTQKEEKNYLPTKFLTSIHLNDDQLASKLAKFIDKYRNRFRLGGSTSRGLGEVSFNVKQDTPKSSVKGQIATFNQILNKRWKSWHDLFGDCYTIHNPCGDRQFFTLNLQSHAILTDKWRRTTVISPTILQQHTGVQDPSLKLESAYSSYDYASGWNSAWGLPKDLELITTQGSVFLFSTENIEAWYSTLEILEYQGIGSRTNEGFGAVKICDPFHTIFQENAV